MFELGEEKTLMISSDNSVKLTTHRIVYESGNDRKQIMLEDFESYELKRSSIGAYGILLFVSVVITVLIVFSKIKNHLDSRKLFNNLNISLFDSFWNDKGFVVLIFVLILFHFFYLISRRYFIKVIGKYNSFEFRVKSFKRPSIQQMLAKLIEQGNNIKKLH